MVDDLKNQFENAIVVFGSVADDKVNLIVGVTKDLSSKLMLVNL
ncbi:alanyl-tRNA synthetase [Actinobacillus equuli]|nr:alanyl-tRNA synthetase [Actinobacillus equuli]